MKQIIKEGERELEQGKSTDSELKIEMIKEEDKDIENERVCEGELNVEERVAQKD